MQRTTPGASRLAFLVLAAAVAVPAHSFAQPDPAAKKPAGDKTGDKRGDGDEVDLTEDLAADEADDKEPSATGDGSEENPDAPKIVGDDPEVDRGAAPRAGRGGYPIEAVLRPITLPKNTSEIAVEIPVHFDPIQASGSLRLSYGITRLAQLNLRYAFGAVDEEEFTTGKAVALDFQYLLTDWIAAQLAVPVYLDPFAIGVTIGAPVKFVFARKASLEIGRDLLNIKISRFFPSIEDPRFNEAQVALDEVGTITDDGFLRLVGKGTYQYTPKMALSGEFGIIGPDFGLTDAGYPLRASIQYSPSRRFDLGARLGFDDLNQAKQSFGVALNVAFRI